MVSSISCGGCDLAKEKIKKNERDFGGLKGACPSLFPSWGRSPVGDVCTITKGQAAQKRACPQVMGVA